MNKRIMGRLGLSFILTILLVPPIGAQEKRAATQTRHTLWKIEGQHATVYLLGSIHALKKENYPLPTVMESAFTNSSIAAFETDVEAAEDPALAIKMMAKLKLPEGETLQTQLSPQVYKQFTNYVQDTGMPLLMFDMLTAPMAAMTLEVLEMQKMGLDPENGVDKYYYPLAKKAGKEIVPLETPDFQINLLTSMSKEDGELLMKATLKEIANTKKDLADLLAAWQSGDADKLEKFLNEAMEEAPAIYKRLVTDRNHNWVPKIEAMVKGEKNAIVIVGAAHLVGKEGVVELLRQKGLKVTQL